MRRPLPPCLLQSEPTAFHEHPARPSRTSFKLNPVSTDAAAVPLPNSAAESKYASTFFGEPDSAILWAQHRCRAYLAM